MASPDTPQKFDAKLFQEMRWRSIGPFRGGARWRLPAEGAAGGFLFWRGGWRRLAQQ